MAEPQPSKLAMPVRSRSPALGIDAGHTAFLPESRADVSRDQWTAPERGLVTLAEYLADWLDSRVDFAPPKSDAARRTVTLPPDDAASGRTATVTPLRRSG